MNPRTPILRLGLRLGVIAAGLAVLLAGCSSDSPVPFCENCEIWSQYTDGLGRFPTPHPINGDIIVFSTIDKTPGAPDSDRQNDEDIWLTWIVDEAVPSNNPIWQLTNDTLGSGGNLMPRWSPLGGQLAFIHTSDGGEFEIWRMTVTPPPSPGGDPVFGAAEIVVQDARDPAWLAEDTLLFTRNDKLWRVDLPASGPPASPPEQISYDPPTYATSERFVDRHPDVGATDADEGVFNATGRQNVADVFVKAFELEMDYSTNPPDTISVTETFDAILGLSRPDARSYPLIDLGDTLTTPALLQSIPVGDGGDFGIEVSLESQFIADSTVNNYCDTLLVQTVHLQGSDVDTVAHYFEEARGTLAITSDLSNTLFSWTRLDLSLSVQDINIQNAGEFRYFDCLLSWEVAGGVPVPGAYEPYLITADQGTEPTFSTTRTLIPGDTTFVTLYPQPEPEARRQRGEAPWGRAVTVLSTSGASAPFASPGDVTFGRALGDRSTLWRMDLSDPLLPEFVAILEAGAQAQMPTISEDFSGTRYLAWTELNDNLGWDLWVQRLVNWQPDRGVNWPLLVPTPGSLDNIDCTPRVIFHPRFLPDTQAGNLHLAVTMTSCPDNAFPGFGSDDEPWAVGELRIWAVRLTTQ